MDPFTWAAIISAIIKLLADLGVFTAIQEWIRNLLSSVVSGMPAVSNASAPTLQSTETDVAVLFATAKAKMKWKPVRRGILTLVEKITTKRTDRVHATLCGVPDTVALLPLGEDEIKNLKGYAPYAPTLVA